MVLYLVALNLTYSAATLVHYLCFEWYGELSILKYFHCFAFFFLKQLHSTLILAYISSFVVALRYVICHAIWQESALSLICYWRCLSGSWGHFISPPSQFYNITCNSIDSMGFVFIHPFCGAFYFFFGIYPVFGFDFIVLSRVGTVWLYSYLQKPVHAPRSSSLSGVISPDRFFPHAHYYLFISVLLICLGLFLASNVSSINPSLFLLALVLHFFFIYLFSSVYSTFLFYLFVCCFLVFCLLFVAILSLSYIHFQFPYLLDHWLLYFILYGVHRFLQYFVHFLYSCFFVFQSVKFFFFFLSFILKGETDCSNTLRSNLSVFCFWIFFSLLNLLGFLLLLLWPFCGRYQHPLWLWLHSWLRSSYLKTFWSQFSFDHTPWRFQIQYLVAAFWENEIVITRLFFQQNPVVSQPFCSCYLFQRAPYVSCCHLYFLLQFWHWSRPCECDVYTIFVKSFPKFVEENLHCFITIVTCSGINLHKVIAIFSPAI